MAAEPLPPIIKRSTPAGQAAVSNGALKSPVFSDPPSPGSPLAAQPATQTIQPQQVAHSTTAGYFGRQPSSILLNKGEGSAVGGVARPASTSRDRSNDGSERATPAPGLHAPQALSPGPAGSTPSMSPAPGLRIASPDGSTASDGGFSSDGGGPASTVPSTVGSPPTTTTFSKPTLSTLYTGGSASACGNQPLHYDAAPAADEVAQAALRRTSSPPSPHCHFAPLPKPEERPGTRRNSTANRVKPYVPPPPPRSAGEASAALDDDDHLPSPPGSYHPGDSSIPSASALSQRLSSSLTFADARSSPSPSHGHTQGHGSASPSRPTSRRSSSSRRSRSPSPHAGRFRSPGHHPAQVALVGGSSRSHSPNLSRHASTDALSLHYIEAASEAAAVARERHAMSRTSSRAGSERGSHAGSAVEWYIGAGASDETGTASHGVGPLSGGGGGGAAAAAAGGGGGMAAQGLSFGKRASADRGPSLSRASSSAGFVDRDKEADLHRLADKAAHGNADAERAVSPALAAQAKRERSAARGQSGDVRDEPRATVIGRRGENEDVVEVGPGEDKDENEGELEEVLEEPEDEEEEDEEDDEGDEDARDEDEDEEAGDNESDGEEAERSRGQDEDDEEEEEEELEERKTSKGAAVEVVRWHRPERERDQERDQQPSPGLRGPSPSPGRLTPGYGGLAAPVPAAP